MKYLKSFLTAAAFLTVFFVSGQSSNELINSIKSVNMPAVETYLQDKIEFCIQEDQQILPRGVASKKFKAFLDEHKPVSLDIIHEGSSKDKSTQYKVAKLVSAKGTFRIFIYSTGEIRQNSVKEIRIDKF